MDSVAIMLANMEKIMDNIFYRYDNIPIYEGGTEVKLTEYKSIKETRCGHWIKPTGLYQYDRKRWISNTTKKRFAYPTKTEAMKSFIRRKELQIWHTEYRLSLANQALVLAKGMMALNNGNLDAT
jgi:hypothetical protein